MRRSGSETSLQPDLFRPETLTSAASKLSAATICADIPNAISSPASPGGHMPSDLLDGPTSTPSGRGAVPASPSAQRTNSPAVKPIDATFFLNSIVSPVSAHLQSCLESRLRARTDLNGSPEFVLTWKHQVMPSGPQIFRLASWARHRSANGSGLWPWASPKASDGEKASNLSHARKAAGRTADNLPGQMRAHWGATVADGAICPEHPSWLMGYPPEFLKCAPSETPSTRTSPRSSLPQRRSLTQDE